MIDQLEALEQQLEELKAERKRKERQTQLEASISRERERAAGGPQAPAKAKFPVKLVGYSALAVILLPFAGPFGFVFGPFILPLLALGLLFWVLQRALEPR